MSEAQKIDAAVWADTSAAMEAAITELRQMPEPDLKTLTAALGLLAEDSDHPGWRKAVLHLGTVCYLECARRSLHVKAERLAGAQVN